MTKPKETNAHPINLRINASQLAKLRGAQVVETLKQGKAVSIQKVIIGLIENMAVDPSPWQQMGALLSDLITQQPEVMTEDQFIVQQQKAHSIIQRLSIKFNETE